jgi:predicted nucleotidyltransferase
MAIRSPLHIARRGDPSEDAVVACFRERVLAACDDRVERIVLFGSRARGDDHAGSDWDFAVLFERAPTEREERSLSELTWAVRPELDTEIQAIARPGRTWRGTDELSCNIREHGVVIHGLGEAPMIERPILQHARAALVKAERFAAQADQAVPHA